MVSKIIQTCIMHERFQVANNGKKNSFKSRVNVNILTTLIVMFLGTTPTSSLRTTNELYPANYPLLEPAQEILNSMNESVDPCDDFYNFACQRWPENNPRPDYDGKWNSLGKLEEQIEKVVIDIMNEPIQESELPAVTTAKQYFQACMNTDTSKEKGDIQFMLDKLESYGGWPILYANGTWDESRFDWVKSVVGLKKEFDVTEILDVISYQSVFRNVSQNAISLQAPSRSSFNSVESSTPLLQEVQQTVDKLTAYQNFIVNVSRDLLIFSGKPESHINSSYLAYKALQITFVEIKLRELATEKDEKGLGRISTKSRITVKEVQMLLNFFTTSEFGTIDIGKLLEAFYLDTEIVTGNASLAVSNLQYLIAISDFISNTKEEALANYLHFRMTIEMISLANIEKFNGYLTTLQNILLGTTTEVPRDLVCARKVKQKFPLALGYAFVQRAELEKRNSDVNFSKIRLMFNDILDEFYYFVKYSALPYVDNYLLSLQVSITDICPGYPTELLDKDAVTQAHANLNITSSYGPNSYLLQSTIINTWWENEKLSKLALPGPSCDWIRFSGTALPWSSKYSVYAPMGILQQPFYDDTFPMSLNYGKLGTILGHEIAHGLVGSGWTSYKDGTITPVTQCFIDQYDNFTFGNTTAGNLSVNGVLTLEENLADNAGLLASFKAYKDKFWFESKHKMKGLEKYNNDQLFYIGYAQNWCESFSEEGLKTVLTRHPHSPGRFRVLGALQNSKEFAETWNCPIGSKMNPAPTVWNDNKCPIF